MKILVTVFLFLLANKTNVFILTNIIYAIYSHNWIDVSELLSKIDWPAVFSLTK